MLNFSVRLGLGFATVSAILTSFLGISPSVSALTITGTSIADITTQDIGQFFTVSFGGQINGSNQDGLLSEAIFKVAGFETVNHVINGITKELTQVKFEVKLSNISTGSIVTSRTSAIGFDVSSDLVKATIAGIDATTQPLFSKAHLNDKLFEGNSPNLDVCFSDNNNNCRGGQSGGVKTGETGTFSTSLYFNSSVKKITLDNLGVRYQSIDLASTPKFDGSSGTGYAVKVVPNGSHDWADSKDSQYW